MTTALRGSERPPKESGSRKKFGGGSRRPLFTQLSVDLLFINFPTSTTGMMIKAITNAVKKFLTERAAN